MQNLSIVKIAVESTIKYITVLVGEDTDLLILLCYYASSDANVIYLKPEQRRNEPRHEIFNNLTSVDSDGLCSLPCSLETPNGVQSVA